MKFSYIDLYAGIGGMRIGFDQACKELGHQSECIFSSEWDKWCKETYKDKVIICNNINSALDNVNSISIITEWDEFKNYDWKTFTHGLKNKISIYDGRNILLDKLSDYPSYFKL